MAAAPGPFGTRRVSTRAGVLVLEMPTKLNSSLSLDGQNSESDLFPPSPPRERASGEHQVVCTEASRKSQAVPAAKPAAAVLMCGCEVTTGRWFRSLRRLNIEPKQQKERRMVQKEVPRGRGGRDLNMKPINIGGSHLRSLEMRMEVGKRRFLVEIIPDCIGKMSCPM